MEKTYLNNLEQLKKLASSLPNTRMMALADIVGSVYSLPFENESFDFAIQNGVFHHLEDEERAIFTEEPPGRGHQTISILRLRELPPPSGRLATDADVGHEWATDPYAEEKFGEGDIRILTQKIR